MRTYILWARPAALRRSYALRASVVALGAALFFLPAPFVEKGTTQTTPPEIEWPNAPAKPTDPKLKQILYTAQVTKAAEEGEVSVADEGNDAFWWVAFAIALGLVLVAPAVRVPR